MRRSVRRVVRFSTAEADGDSQRDALAGHDGHHVRENTVSHRRLGRLFAGFKASVMSASIEPETNLADPPSGNGDRGDQRHRTTSGVLTLQFRTRSSHQSAANESVCLPVPSGLPGRYVLKITGVFHVTAAATVGVS